MNRIIQSTYGQLKTGCEFTVPRVGRFRKVEPVRDGDKLRGALHLKTGGMWSVDDSIPVNVKKKDAGMIRDFAATLTFDVERSLGQVRAASPTTSTPE